MADLRSPDYTSSFLDSTGKNDEKLTNTLFPMEECENLDAFNDETFGSDSFEAHWDDTEVPTNQVDEFERWKEEQKQSLMKIPLDEAPARTIPEVEEKLAQAMSKLNTMDLESKEYCEPLPNADAIEAIWTTSPKHSSNIGTPDSPYLQDLLSPTHNIWGSPSSDERKASDEADSAQMSKQPFHDKNDESRTSFSPVLEDEAIVSALPKRIPKPICVEDLEKLDFGRQIGPHAPQLFVNDVPKVRPPPGFSPNPNMGPYPVRPIPFNVYPVQPAITPAQAHAYYAAMMKQRMTFASSPYCRTPTQPFPPPPYFRSDPGHLQNRPPNMVIPRHHARFITPQPRPMYNNNSSGSRGAARSYDNNRRRPQHYIESPKYRPQYYVSEDEDEEEEGALMTSKEKDWLIRIQLMQLTTDKPELDDYYFHTHERRRLAKERAMRSTGVERDIHESNKDAEMSLPHVTKGGYHYKPMKFEGSLGQLSVGSVVHPREVVQVGNSGRPKGPVGSLKETKKKYQLLLTIEKGFDQILPIEDLERMALQMPHDVRPQLYERRDKLFQRCYDLIGLKTSNDSNKKYNDETLLQMLSVRKGRRLLSKMMRILKEAQRHDIALAITRNLRTLTKKDVYNEGKESLCEALVNVINGSSSDKLVEHYKNIVGGKNGSILQLFSSKFTLKIVLEMIKTMSVLAKNIDEESEPLQTIWPTFLSLAIRDFVTASPKVLAKNYQEVGNLVDFFSDNAEQNKISIIQEHYRLVENARVTSPSR